MSQWSGGHREEVYTAEMKEISLLVLVLAKTETKKEFLDFSNTQRDSELFLLLNLIGWSSLAACFPQSTGIHPSSHKVFHFCHACQQAEGRHWWPGMVVSPLEPFSAKIFWIVLFCVKSRLPHTVCSLPWLMTHTNCHTNYFNYYYCYLITVLGFFFS